MHVFYTPDILNRAELPEDEATHALRVLRLQTGDEVTLTDGKGSFYRAEISAASGKRCLVNILESQQQPPLWQGHLHIAMATDIPQLPILRAKSHQDRTHPEDTDFSHQTIAQSTPAPAERNDGLPYLHPATFQRTEIHSPLLRRRKTAIEGCPEARTGRTGAHRPRRGLQRRRSKSGRRTRVPAHQLRTLPPPHGDSSPRGLPHSEPIQPIMPPHKTHTTCRQVIHFLSTGCLFSIRKMQ